MSTNYSMHHLFINFEFIFHRFRQIDADLLLIDQLLLKIIKYKLYVFTMNNFEIWIKQNNYMLHEV